MDPVSQLPKAPHCQASRTTQQRLYTYLEPLNLPDPVAAQLQQREVSEARQALNCSDLVGGTEELTQGRGGGWLRAQAGQWGEAADLQAGKQAGTQGW
jgi:hypothetical protein